MCDTDTVVKKRDVLILEEAAYCDEGFFYETGMSSQSSKLVQPTTDRCDGSGTHLKCWKQQSGGHQYINQ
jgi:hypothetical protein